MKNPFSTEQEQNKNTENILPKNTEQNRTEQNTKNSMFFHPWVAPLPLIKFNFSDRFKFSSPKFGSNFRLILINRL